MVSGAEGGFESALNTICGAMSDVSRSAVRAVNLPSMTSLRTILLAALCAGFTACQSTTQVRPTKLAVVDTRGMLRNVRTTAYTHSESDHIVYGAKSAVGTDLKYGTVRSAAADWLVIRLVSLRSRASRMFTRWTTMARPWLALKTISTSTVLQRRR